MDMKQLEAFVAVIKYNSFTKAANHIYLSQPTISSHVRSLEKELEVQLIVRTGKDVYPTSSGKELFIQAQNILNIRDEAINRIKGIDSKIKKDISIVASSVPAQYLLPRLIADFQKDY